MVSYTLEGRVALVTGASEGIGYSISASLAERGASLVLLARNHEKLRAAYDNLSSYGGPHLSIPTNVGVWEDVEKAVDTAWGTYGKIDILVNNAGIAPLDLLKNLSPSTILAAVQTNLLGPLHFYKKLIPLFELQQSGVVVDIISQAGVKIMDQNGVYAPTKFGHRALSLVVEQELPFLTIYRIYPGVVRTKAWDKETSPLKRTIKESSDKLHPDQVGRFVADIIENPSLADTHDVMLQPQKDGGMEKVYLSNTFMEVKEQKK